MEEASQREEGALGFGSDPLQCCPKALVCAAGSAGTFVLQGHFSCVLEEGRAAPALGPGGDHVPADLS